MSKSADEENNNSEESENPDANGDTTFPEENAPAQIPAAVSDGNSQG